jgi:hypothetical protein
MIPPTFVILDHLPVTTNGKIDRRALPFLEAQRTNLEDPITPPRTRLENMLVDNWKEILGQKQCGIHDNFFELGGHSLLATRLISRIGKVFELEIPFRCLFLHPTIAEFSGEIENLLTQEISDLEEEKAEELLNTKK